MIRKAAKGDIPECVEVIRRSFRTVADEFGFLPSACGYMEKSLK